MPNRSFGIDTSSIYEKHWVFVTYRQMIDKPILMIGSIFFVQSDATVCRLSACWHFTKFIMCIVSFDQVYFYSFCIFDRMDTEVLTAITHAKHKRRRQRVVNNNRLRKQTAIARAVGLNPYLVTAATTFNDICSSPIAHMKSLSLPIIPDNAASEVDFDPIENVSQPFEEDETITSDTEKFNNDWISFVDLISHKNKPASRYLHYYTNTRTVEFCQDLICLLPKVNMCKSHSLRFFSLINTALPHPNIFQHLLKHFYSLLKVRYSLAMPNR
jgi:hypothetical protein